MSDNLFLMPPTINPADYLPSIDALKVAGTKLTSPPAYWDDEITQVLLREHPYIDVDRAIVNFTKRDDGSGCAMGFISVVGAPRLSIPVVVKNWELSPLDILINRQDNPADNAADQQGSGDMEDDQVMPLDEDTFQAALDAGSMGEPVPRHINLNTGYSEDGSSLRLPFRGRTVLASYMGASEDRKKEAEAVLAANRDILVGFAANETGAVLDSWMNAGEPANTVLTKLAEAEVPRTHASILRLSDDIRELKTAEFVAADIIDADQNIKSAVAFDAINLAAPTEKVARWLIFEDGTFCRAQPEVTGTAFEGEKEASVVEMVLEKTASTQLRVGGHFVFHDDNVFTAPAKLASIAIRDDQRTVELDMTDDLGTRFHVSIDGRVKVAMFDEETSTWIMPTSAHVLALGNHQDVPSLEAEKVAKAIAATVPDELIHANGQWTLNLQGDSFLGQATREKMAELLDSHLENADELMKEAEENGSVRFASSLPAQIEALVEKVAAYKDAPAFAAEAMSDLRLDMAKGLKLAASLGDPESVDAVLGASFLTEDNLAEFVGLADQFNETVGKLARLLLAIRMGLPGDETATTVAMKSLARVAERLQSASSEVAA